MATEKCCMKARGAIWVQPWLTKADAVENFERLGNSETFEIQVEETTNSVQDFDSLVGGVDCSTTEITDVTFSITVYCWNIANLARMFYGEETKVAGAAQTETKTLGAVPDCKLVRLDYLPDTAQAVTVTGANSGVLTQGTDWDWSPTESGIILAETGGAAQPNDVLTITYTSIDTSVTEMFQRQSELLEFLFDAKNVAADGGDSRFTVGLYKCRLNPAASIALKSADEFQSFEMTGTVESDSSRSGLNGSLGQYGYVNQAD